MSERNLPKLTDGEWVIMKAIWEEEPCAAATVSSRSVPAITSVISKSVVPLLLLILDLLSVCVRFVPVTILIWSMSYFRLTCHLLVAPSSIGHPIYRRLSLLKDRLQQQVELFQRHCRMTLALRGIA